VHKDGEERVKSTRMGVFLSVAERRNVGDAGCSSVLAVMVTGKQTLDARGGGTHTTLEAGRSMW